MKHQPHDWFSPLFATSVLLVLNGCGGGPDQDNYRVIDQSPVEVSRSESDEPQTADAMMSIRQEQLPTVEQKPTSALEYSNRQPELLIPHKAFRRDQKTNALLVSYDDLNLLKVLNMDPVTENAVTWMPDWMRSLDGQKVRVRGYMYPPFLMEDIGVFVLLRDNLECCFGPGAKVYDHIEVRMKDGTPARYVSLKESLDVVGRFKIELHSAEGSVYDLYVIEDAVAVYK